MMTTTHDEAHRTLLSPIDSMTDALLSERRLIEDLATVMRRQRSAVGNDDLQAVDDSVFATHRILVTLSEARRRRRSLNQLIGQPEDLGIFALEEALGARMTDELRAARDGLHESARTLAREVSINRRVLRGALATGDSFARMLANASSTQVYTPSKGMETRTQGTSLVDRRI